MHCNRRRYAESGGAGRAPGAPVKAARGGILYALDRIVIFFFGIVIVIVIVI